MERGHIDAELADRAGADAVGDLLKVRGDGVQRPAQAVVVEQLRLDAEDLHRPLAAQSSTRHSGAGAVSRLATSVSMTAPCVT
ncbi:hypothetical protein [Streptomyces sp. F001]|uniref:hypothetical protein n=1 Tax=Streptomyces sp. F001 TaxID=1510026 RepID=UPI001F0F36B6|nr:hypothetical protein [Streptomyces sp. F001]